MNSMTMKKKKREQKKKKEKNWRPFQGIRYFLAGLFSISSSEQPVGRWRGQRISRLWWPNGGSEWESDKCIIQSMHSGWVRAFAWQCVSACHGIPANLFSKLFFFVIKLRIIAFSKFKLNSTIYFFYSNWWWSCVDVLSKQPTDITSIYL